MMTIQHTLQHSSPEDVGRAKARSAVPAATKMGNGGHALRALPALRKGFTKWNTEPRKARVAKAGGLAPERVDAS